MQLKSNVMGNLGSKSVQTMMFILFLQQQIPHMVVEWAEVGQGSETRAQLVPQRSSFTDDNRQDCSCFSGF